MKSSQELYSFIQRDINFPISTIIPTDLIDRRGFFPVCNGTINGSDNLEDLKVMIVGQDFGKTSDYEKAKEDGENIDTVSTWKQLIPMLGNLGINENRCFYTNYLMGVRISKSSVGPSPGLAHKEYLLDCMSFFRRQIEYIKPHIILFLGKVPFRLATSEDFKKQLLSRPYLEEIRKRNIEHPYFENYGKKIFCFYLIHPSQRRLNILNGNWDENYEKELRGRVIF